AGVAVVRMDVVASPQPRRGGGDQAHEQRHREDDGQAVLERRRDQLGKERLAGQVGGLVGRQGRQHLVAEQRVHRVVAEEGGEEAADRRQVGQLGGGGRRHSVGG